MTDVAFLHAGSRCSNVRRQLDSFAAEHNVLAFDLPGFGSEPLLPGRLSYVEGAAERTLPGAAVVGASSAAGAQSIWLSSGRSSSAS